MKKSMLWFLAFVITLAAAYYQRKTGPTYPKAVNVTVNDSVYELKLVRSLGLDERPEVKLGIADTSIRARLFYKRFRTNDEYSESEFRYKVYPVNSPLMNRVFKVTEERGFFAEIPQQPPAGKLQYYLELTDSQGTTTLNKENPVVIRFKSVVPSLILTPHILFMFLAMLLSTFAGLLALIKHPHFRKYSLWTLIILIIGGMILGPLVQKYAFGAFWTGWPFGHDLTDNKTLVAFLAWLVAYLRLRKDNANRAWVIAAAIILLMVYLIPHSMFGSELDYNTGDIKTGK